MLNALKKITIIIAIFAVLVIGGIAAIWYFSFAAPSKSSLVINEPRLSAYALNLDGTEPLSVVIDRLQENHVIKSSKTAMSIILRLGTEKKIKQGVYVFKGGENVLTILSRLANADYGYDPVRITIPEGFTIRKIAARIHANMPEIDEQEFFSLAEPLEGHLFPDTYFFYPYATSSVIIKTMEDAFDNIWLGFKSEFEARRQAAPMLPSGMRDTKLRDNPLAILTMASILEKEVQTPADKAIVADLFWRRIENGMPLQADSTLTYYLGKTSAEITLSDLRSDSPYNSYTNKGLPPTPISNPGLDSIKAALFPTKNDYVYFLSDGDGITHFSKTYEEHLRLKKKYL